MKDLKNSSLAILALASLTLGVQITPAQAAAIRSLSGFTTSSLPANDDGSTGSVTLPFTVNFFGNLRSSLFVNNNGNLTFDSALSSFTPFDLTSTAREIIAPFFADVDTRGTGSVTYGTDTVDGRTAFGVNYSGVGYYSVNTDRTNSFQALLIDRSDTGSGNFDIEFNYDQIQWETGDASGGVNGLGGNSARIGYSNGTGNPGTSFELAGSAINGAFLDSNTTTGLIHNSLNSNVDGRYVFSARNGSIVSDPQPVPEPASMLGILAFGVLGGRKLLNRKQQLASPER